MVVRLAAALGRSPHASQTGKRSAIQTQEGTGGAARLGAGSCGRPLARGQRIGRRHPGQGRSTTDGEGASASGAPEQAG